MLGSNSITKSQRKNKNSNSKSQYSKTRKGRKINSSTYNVYDIEQSTSKPRRRSVKSNKSNETINNIDIIEDIDKVDNNDKTILPPLSPISISSETPDSVIEIPDSVPKVDTITIVIDGNHNNVITSAIDDDENIEIINEKYIKYSKQPTVFETFSKNNVLWCHYCGTTKTSSWRHGPWGKKSLCNKHGCDYKGYGFTVRQPRLDLSQFTKESNKRIRPVIQEYCCVCFSNDSNKDNALVMCNGCYRSYHQNCHPDKIDSSIVNSSEPYYCKEACKHTRSVKMIETELPRKNLPFMFNRGLTNNQKSSKSSKSIQNKLKLIEGDKEESSSIPSSPASTTVSSPFTTTPTSSTPSSPSKVKSIIQDIQEPEPKIYKHELDSIIKERHIRKRGAKEEDTIIHYTKNLPPIVGFKHDEIPIPTWVYSENLNNNSNSSPTKRKRKGKEEENEEMLEDISDEAYAKRHHPLELSEKYSRCGSLINTSKIDEEAINKIIEKQSKKRKLKKGYIYI